jgi:ABC-type branched-subunit amino acid transport system ATPase component
MDVLELASVSKSFGGVHAVQRCSFSVAARTVTALIGPNGAGKTTALNCISGVLVPEHGRVLFRGDDVTAWPAWRRSRAGLSRTFQLSRLFRNLSVRDNLALAVRQHDDRFWRSVLQQHDDAATMASVRAAAEFIGLRKDLDAAVTDLSYGEQKLFDLARAMLNPHVMLLLDEPVAGINPVLRTKLVDILRALKERHETILFVEHDIDFVRTVADHVIVMDQGAVLTAGPPDEVLRDRRVLDAYLGPA